MDKTTNRTHIRLINKVLKSTGAQNETRTHTPLPALPPQSSVYTNFTTCAYCALLLIIFLISSCKDNFFFRPIPIFIYFSFQKESYPSRTASFTHSENYNRINEILYCFLFQVMKQARRVYMN